MLQALEREHPYQAPQEDPKPEEEKPEDKEPDELEFTPGYMNGNDDVVKAFQSGKLKYNPDRECLVDEKGNEIYDYKSFAAAGLAKQKGKAADTFDHPLHEGYELRDASELDVDKKDISY